MNFKFRLYYQVSLTGTWMPMNETYYSKQEAIRHIEMIEQGNTIYRDDLKYKVIKE